MKARRTLKRLAESIPYGIGKWTSFIPFSARLGQDYTKFRSLVVRYDQAPNESRLAYLINRLNTIVNHAIRNSPFYRDLYGSASIKIGSLEDFAQLPIITKAQVRKYTAESTGAMLINTGGSSGEPLSFYIDKNAWAREWAHMHYIWGMRGYKQTDLMLTMLGKNLGDDFYRYNAVHNEIKINPYMDAGKKISEVKALFNKFPIMYLQGYPSSIYNFLREIEPFLRENEKKMLLSRVKCCFLSSEFPLPYIVDYLSNSWKLDCLSWYGHSEMCILAYDYSGDGRYRPLVTYGYAEEVAGVLCGTSFNNFDMPLIRYSTGDGVRAVRDRCGVVEYFEITDGREGDFIEDRFGKRLPLTSFVFGRHHKIFDLADFVQIHQPFKGAATFYISLPGTVILLIEDLSKYFDLRDINIDFVFVIIRKPIRTKAGKLKLKLGPEDISEGNECKV